MNLLESGKFASGVDEQKLPLVAVPPHRGMQGGLLQPVGLPQQPLHPVAVHRMTENLFRNDHPRLHAETGGGNPAAHQLERSGVEGASLLEKQLKIVFSAKVFRFRETL